ncbi:hypothetical protein [Lewinella sp. JB7]|uniref:hypothetical protein n=1 Tax=Lewinella sp. JB7 TaxID=2962887 RepID=UPI0020C995D6|nr:hypothetical protein [Lewinella sp. JB7]MCP9235586.1 hypothetical protein [Lewinella sp. JB7]
MLLSLSGVARGQLQMGAGAGAKHAQIQQTLRVATPSLRHYPQAWLLTEVYSTRGPAPSGADARKQANADFDFTSTKPYLAFFCRLELQLEEATRFPVRFRLGEVRTWQQELTKRE